MSKKNVVEPEKLQMTIWHTRLKCWISKATRVRVNAHALHPSTNICTHAYRRARKHRKICNICWFFMATIVSRISLNTMLYVHFLSCYRLMIVWWITKALLRHGWILVLGTEQLDVVIHHFIMWKLPISRHWAIFTQLIVKKKMCFLC